MRRITWIYLTLCVLLCGCSGAQDDADTMRYGVDDSGAAPNDGQDSSTGPVGDIADVAGVLVINEVVVRASRGGDDWFELLNLSDALVDLSGYVVEDDGGNSYTFPPDTTIVENGYLVVEASVFGFGLGKDDALVLKDVDGLAVDSADWMDGDAPEGSSYGRFPNGTGPFKTLAEPTKGAENIDNGVSGVCDDGTCDSSEDCASCPQDCGACIQIESDAVINEVVASAVDNGPDWIELANTSDADILLEGWSLVDAGENTVVFSADVSLPANGYLLLTRGIDFEFGVGGSDALTLKNASGGIVDSTDWNEGDALSGTSWGRLPDKVGAFQTLDVLTPAAKNTATSEPTCGDGQCNGIEDCDTCETDCGACPVLAPKLVVNEVVATASGGGADWVELANIDATPHDLTGWSIQDAGGSSYIFPDGTFIPASGYLLLTSDLTFSFGLGSEDTVILLDATGKEIDTVDWAAGDAPEGSSWARIPDKTGSFQTTNQPTPDAPNVPSAVSGCGDGTCDDSEDCSTCEADCGSCLAPAEVVINEIVAKAVDGGVDWIEIHNIGTDQADVSGWTVQDDGGNVYALPTPTNILVGGYYLMTQDEFGFGLGKDDSVTLKNSAGTVIDVADWNDGDAPEGSSWARIPNGTGPFVTTPVITPDAANQSGTSSVVCGDTVCDQTEDCGTCATDCGTCTGCPTDLFISEYVEGSASNKAIELFNGTGASVDLGLYEIWTISNGGEWPESTTPLSGTLASGDVFVLCNSGMDPAAIGFCDAVYGANPVNFNGNDAVGLARDNGGTYLLIDQVGDSGPDIGDGWAVGGVAAATKNSTLVRKAASTGLTVWGSSSANDWLVYGQDIFEFLGGHTFSSPDCP